MENKEKYDYLIVGCGLFGCVFAREMTDAGYKCLIIDKRSHVGGNVYTENIEGINVHKYGAHIFHTNDKRVWDYVNKFAPFNNYRHKVFVSHDSNLYSFPINLFTLYQLYHTSTPNEAVAELERRKVPCDNPKNLEEWILSQVGTELYEIFIKGYTTKQWGKLPDKLPSSIIKRIPIRTELNDFYFDDLYQGIPTGGYTALIEKMIDGIDVKLNVDYFKDRAELDSLANNIVYTGKIDEFCDYKFGELEYRSLDFEHKVIETPSFQGTSVVNYTNIEVPYTRILEHKHFEFGKTNSTVITYEYPAKWEKGRESYYPVNDEANNKQYMQYKKYSEEQNPNVIFGGRLAEYKYYDMHQVVGSALAKSRHILAELKNK